jgi:hypothetical protein
MLRDRVIGDVRDRHISMALVMGSGEYDSGRCASMIYFDRVRPGFVIDYGRVSKVRREHKYIIVHVG